MANSKRLFIGFMISDTVGHQLISKVKQHKHCITPGIRWTINGNFHITSHFLGDTDEDKIHQIITALQLVTVSKSATTIIIHKIATFPQYKSRLLAAYIQPNNMVSKVFNELKVYLNALNIGLDKRDYIPHITLARNFSNDMTEVGLVNDFTIKINKLALYESIQSPSGSHYIPLFTTKLG